MITPNLDFDRGNSDEPRPTILFSKSPGFPVFLLMFLVFLAADFVVVYTNFPQGRGLTLHEIVLGGSTLIFLVGVHLVTIRAPIKRSQSYLDRVSTVLDGPFLYEAAWLIFGWLSLYYAPAITPLRLFRVLRLIWHISLLDLDDTKKSSKRGEAEMEVKRRDTMTQSLYSLLWILKLFNMVLNYFFLWLIESCRRISQYYEQIGREAVTAKSKGSMVLLSSFFFVIYVTAVVYWHNFNGLLTPEEYTCNTVAKCFTTLLRLCLYDGMGLDFLQAVVDKNRTGYVILLLVFMIIADVILLNGLIGVFGLAFDSEAKEDGPDESAKIELMRLVHHTDALMADITKALDDLNIDYNRSRFSQTRRCKKNMEVALRRAFVPIAETKNESATMLGDDDDDDEEEEEEEEEKLSTRLDIPVDKARDILSAEWYFSAFVVIGIVLMITEIVVIGFPLPGVTYLHLGPSSTSTMSKMSIEHSIQVEWMYYLQIGILGMSTLLFVVGLVITANQYDRAVVALIAQGLSAAYPDSKDQFTKYYVAGFTEKFDLFLPPLKIDDAVSMLVSALDTGRLLKGKRYLKTKESLVNLRAETATRLSYLQKIQKMFDAEVWLELAFLIFGWSTIFVDPAISVLRCFRVIRVFWFFEVFENPTRSTFGILYPMMKYLTHAIQLYVCYLEKLPVVMFRNGGIEVVLVFIFVIYVFALVFWNEEANLMNIDSSPQCQDVLNCCIVLLRLAVFDGNGLDFMETMIFHGSPALGSLAIVMMIIAGMILYFGWVGIAGMAFSSGIDDDDMEEDDDDDFDDEDEDGDENVEMLGTVSERKNLELQRVDTWTGDERYDGWKILLHFGKAVDMFLASASSIIDEAARAEKRLREQQNATEAVNVRDHSSGESQAKHHVYFKDQPQQQTKVQQIPQQHKNEKDHHHHQEQNRHHHPSDAEHLKHQYALHKQQQQQKRPDSRAGIKAEMHLVSVNASDFDTTSDIRTPWNPSFAEEENVLAKKKRSEKVHGGDDSPSHLSGHHGLWQNHHQIHDQDHHARGAFDVASDTELSVGVSYVHNHGLKTVQAKTQHVRHHDPGISVGLGHKDGEAHDHDVDSTVEALLAEPKASTVNGRAAAGGGGGSGGGLYRPKGGHADVMSMANDLPMLLQGVGIKAPQKKAFEVAEHQRQAAKATAERTMQLFDST